MSKNGGRAARRQASIGVYRTRAIPSRIRVSEISLLRFSDSGELRVRFLIMSVRLREGIVHEVVDIEEDERR